MDTGASLEVATVVDLDGQGAPVAVTHGNDDRAVAEHQRVSHVHVIEQTVVVDFDHLGVAVAGPGNEAQPLAVGEFEATFGERAGAHLGARQVHEDAERPPRSLGRGAKAEEPLDLQVERVVGKTETGHVHACLDQALHHRGRLGRGPDGGDDLGATGHGPPR